MQRNFIHRQSHVGVEAFTSLKINGAQQISISGSNFTDVHGNYHYNVNHQTYDMGIQSLLQHIAENGLHDALERYPPPNCHPGTREVVLQIVKAWIHENDSETDLLWLSGSKGSGKSAIMQAIVDELLREDPDNHRIAASFFFGREGGKRSLGRYLFPTLAYQLALNVAELREPINLIMQTDPTLPTRHIETQFQSLIVNPFRACREQNITRNVIMIDGLNECEDDDIQQLIIELVGSTHDIHHPPLRFVIASCPERHICDVLDRPAISQRLRRVDLDTFETHKDIEKFLREKFSETYQRRSYLMRHISPSWPGESIISQLVASATGRFTLASNIVKFINDKDSSPEEQLELVLDRTHNPLALPHGDAWACTTDAGSSEYTSTSSSGLAKQSLPSHAMVTHAETTVKHEFSNTLITGGTFVSVEERSSLQTHTHLTTEERMGMRKLGEAIAPGAFHDSAERYDPPKCHPRTREAVLEKIMDWVQELEDSERHSLFMWLYGPAGSGKSAIAQTIAEQCYGLGLLAASFFFSRTATGRNDDSHLVATLAYQLCLSIPEIRTSVEDAVELNPSIFSYSPETQLQKLIIEPFSRIHGNLNQSHSRIHPRLIIVDGLDECASAIYVQRYVLQVLADKLPNHMIFLVTSRPEPHIRRFFGAEPMASRTTTLTLNDSDLLDTASDLRVYLEAGFDAIKRDHPLGCYLPESWPSSVDIDHLIRKSSGQFIYASTVMKYVASRRHRPMDRLDIIFGKISDGKGTPYTELDALYSHIFSCVEDISKVLEVFGVLLLVKRKTSLVLLTLALVEQLLGLLSGDLEVILIDLHSVLDIPAQRDIGEIQILHASLGDFLLDQTRSGPYYINPEHAHASLTRQLMRCIPQNVTSNNNLSKFSCAIFTVHCTKSYPTAELLDALWNFNIFTFWTLYFSQDYNEFVRHELSHISPEASRASLSLDLFTWLKNSGSGEEGRDLYSHYMLAWDRYIQHSLTELSVGPLESQYIVFFILPQFRNNYPAQDIFTWDTFGADYQSLSNISSTFEYHDGDSGYDLFLTEFFSSLSRSGPFYLDGNKYASFAITFTKYLIRRASSTEEMADWERDSSCLSILLPKSSYSEELVTLLNLKLLLKIEIQRPELARKVVDIVNLYCNSFTSNSRHAALRPTGNIVSVMQAPPRAAQSIPVNISLFPLPTGGFPRIQGLTDMDMRANIGPNSLALWETYQGAAVLAYIPHDKPAADSSTKATKIRNFIQSIFNPPGLVVSAPQYVNSGYLVKKSIYPFFIGGISIDQAQVLLDRICWSTSIITFFTVPFTPFVSDFIMTLQNVPLTSTRENELVIAEVVKDVIRTNPVLRHFLTKHHDAVPDYPAIEETINYISDSVRAAGLNTIIAGNPVTLFNIFATPPSHDAATYEYWVFQLRNITYFSGWGTHTAKEPFSCDCCKSTDHPVGLCPFQAIPGFPVALTTSTANQEDGPQPGNPLLAREKEIENAVVATQSTLTENQLPGKKSILTKSVGLYRRITRKLDLGRRL